MNVGSLFSGIGGIDLGLERAGMHVAWQCEVDPWCRGILARHWPGVPCYGDVRSIGADAPRVDVLAGGFPCQPVSLAGKGLAQADERWLWPEFARLVRVLRPRYVIAENVPGLLARGLDIVLADLAALGFDAEWTVFGARDVGAPHKRDRVWIVAWDDRVEDPDGSALEPRRRGWGAAEAGEPSSTPADADGDGLERRSQRDERPAGRIEAQRRHDAVGLREALADASGARLEGEDEREPEHAELARRGGDVAHAARIGSGPSGTNGSEPQRTDRSRGSRQRAGAHAWPAEPDVGRVAHGVPARVDRLRALGNAVVPACAEHIGRLVMEMAPVQVPA